MPDRSEGHPGAAIRPHPAFPSKDAPPRAVLERIELSEALKGRGCPFCQVAAQAGRRYLRHFLHELVLDGGLRLALHRSGGFCRDHAWELQRLEVERWHDNMGTATVYEDLARAVARTIRTRPVEAGRPRWFRHRTPDRPPLTRALVPGNCARPAPPSGSMWTI